MSSHRGYANEEVYDSGDHRFESLEALERILLGRSRGEIHDVDQDFAKAGSHFVRMFRELAEESLKLSGYEILALGPSSELPGSVTYAYMSGDGGGTMRQVNVSVPIQLQNAETVEAIIAYEGRLRSPEPATLEKQPVSDVLSFEPLRIVGKNDRTYSVYGRARRDMTSP